MPENCRNLTLQVIPSQDVAETAPIEIAPETQLEYLRIYHKRAVCQENPIEIAKELGISLSQVYASCRWVRDNWEVLNTEQYFADAEALCSSRIREYDAEIAKAELGEPYEIEGKPLRDSLGNLLMRVNRSHIRGLMRDRSRYDEMLLNVRGLFQKSQIIVAKNSIIGNVSVNLNSILALSEKMTEGDRETLKGICGKYGERPR